MTLKVTCYFRILWARCTSRGFVNKIHLWKHARRLCKDKRENTDCWVKAASGPYICTAAAAQQFASGEIKFCLILTTRNVHSVLVLVAVFPPPRVLKISTWCSIWKCEWQTSHRSSYSVILLSSLIVLCLHINNPTRLGLVLFIFWMSDRRWLMSSAVLCSLFSLW